MATLLEELKEEYLNQENCMYDFLADKAVPKGVTFEESMGIYAKLMNWAENDEFHRTNKEDGFEENLVTGEKYEI
jgi:hypothetical protein